MSNIDYGELEKYFTFLKNGNAIAARLHNGQINEHVAKELFGIILEQLAQTIKDERS